MGDPEISVVMSVYNGERYLREAVESILNQTFRDFEFIIVNDGSTDGTKGILESYRDERIVLINQENIGLTRSLNKGIAIAKGKYIARQDADDASLPERLGKQIEFMENNQNVSLLGTATRVIDGKGELLKISEYPCDDSSIRAAMQLHNCFCHGSVIFKRQCFKELGGYREFFPASQDYDLWLRVADKFKMDNLSEPLYNYRFNCYSLTFSRILAQRRMSIFARQLAKTREDGFDEAIELSKMEEALDLPPTMTEKCDIIKSYNPWGELLLKHGRKDEAFSLMTGVFKFHPSAACRLMFSVAKILRSSLLLERLILRYE